MKSAKRQFCAAMLALEAFVVLFAALVLHGLDDVPRLSLWLVSGWLIVTLITVAGMLSQPWAYHLGSVLQVVVLLSGFILPSMFFIGGLFVLLWIASLVLGRKIDRERAERLLADQGEEEVESNS